MRTDTLVPLSSCVIDNAVLETINQALLPLIDLWTFVWYTRCYISPQLL